MSKPTVSLANSFNSRVTGEPVNFAEDTNIYPRHLPKICTSNIHRRILMRTGSGRWPRARALSRCLQRPLMQRQRIKPFKYAFRVFNELRKTARNLARGSRRKLVEFFDFYVHRKRKKCSRGRYAKVEWFQKRGYDFWRNAFEIFSKISSSPDRWYSEPSNRVGKLYSFLARFRVFERFRASKRLSSLPYLNCVEKLCSFLFIFYLFFFSSFNFSVHTPFLSYSFSITSLARYSQIL